MEVVPNRFNVLARRKFFAIWLAKCKATTEPYGALLTVEKRVRKDRLDWGQKQQPVLAIGLIPIYKLFQERILSRWILFAFLSVAAWLSLSSRDVTSFLQENTELVVTLAALLLTVATAIAGLISIDHKTSWRLRRTIIVKAINLGFVSLVAIVLVIVYPSRVCNRDHELIEVIWDLVGAITIAMLVLIIWGIWRLLVSLYFFAINAEYVSGCGPGGEDTQEGEACQPVDSGDEGGCGG